MTGRNGSQKKGLVPGFLTGTALCLCLGAAASYISPRPSDLGGPVPSVETSEQVPVAPNNVTTELAIITPKSDTVRDIGDVPSNEAPVQDRDDATVTASLREATDPVQTGTLNIETPAPSETVEALTSTTQETAPQKPVVSTLKTAEVAPEQNVAEIDVSSGTANASAPEVETSGVTSPKSQDDTITLALNAPQVEAPEASPKPAELDTSSAPEVAAMPLANGDDAAVKTKPVAPKARPVIALNQPSTSAPKATTQTVPLVRTLAQDPETSETKPSDDPVLVSPQTDEDAPRLPQSENPSDTAPQAPVQVETPLIDKEPEAPVIQQAAIAPQNDGSDATGAADNQAVEEDQQAAPEPAANTAVDDRNPPPPTFTGRAFDAFAVDFIPPNNKPFLTIVLEHVGEGSVDMYDLLNFGQPITFGISSADGLAPWRESEFRKAGFEVVALVPADPNTGLSEGMDEEEAAERIDNFLVAVPGAVAILDQSSSDLYRDPRKVIQVSQELGLTGRGFVFHEKFGVNRALEAARSTGIPSASLVRVIDDQRDAANIRRALDRAALDASKTGAAIVYGRTYPETVAALLPWLLGNSARSVTMAPLTSTMKRMVE